MVLADRKLAPRSAAEATTRLAVAERLRGDEDTAAQTFSDARRAWQEMGDRRGEALALRLAGWAELVAGRPRAALPRLLRAIDLEEQLGGVEPETVQYLGWCEYLSGEIEAARSHLWSAADSFLTTGDVAGVGWCFGSSASASGRRGGSTRR